ncbi:MAG: DUF4124 domain-containing protein [Betaproteobacteria bacterium]|nr:DUF4124 domain-containing protein [Betaproteobacteria bacterium]
MRSLIGLAAVLAVTLAPQADAATLNKCIDAKGEVTYSNLPCRNAREVRTLEVDPAPPADTPARPAAERASPGSAATDAAPRRKEPAAPRAEPRRISEKSAAASMRRCDTLTDKLGRVFDTMDRARRSGYTQKQMDAWNLEAKDLERKKQQAGCF